MTVAAPDLPRELEHIRRLPASEPGQTLELAGAVVESELPVQAGRIRVDGCELRGVAFAPGRRAGLTMLDATLSDCDLSNVAARGAHLARVEIQRSRLVGFSVDGGGVNDLRIADSTLEFGSFAAAGLQSVEFRSVNLVECSFAEARMVDVVFDDCRLAGVDFRRARLRDCVIRGCSLDGVLGVESLRGVTMPWPDVLESAGALAAALGIRIEDGG